MNERKAREAVEGRLYKNHLKTTGALPDAKKRKVFEHEARRSAERVGRKKK